jgi:hypothetical protein
VDVLPQAVTDAWATSIASSPVVGALSMLLLVLGMNWIKSAFPALVPGGGGKPPAHDAEPGRGWQTTLADASEHIDQIADVLKARNELARREIEAVERIERLLVELLARERAAAARNPSAPRPRPTGA